MTQTFHEDHVFINCPFDSEYTPLFQAVVFAVHDCGFVARCALESDDAGQVRIDKILQIIGECGLGIHDISHTEADPTTGLPRFNMPLELGLFLGARRFGRGVQKKKICLILDREPYRYQQFCSDIAGQDIRSHRRDVETAVGIIRDWLRNASKGSGVTLPGGAQIASRYRSFRKELPSMCAEARWDPDRLIFTDFVSLVVGWLKKNP